MTPIKGIHSQKAQACMHCMPHVLKHGSSNLLGYDPSVSTQAFALNNLCFKMPMPLYMPSLTFSKVAVSKSLRDMLWTSDLDILSEMNTRLYCPTTHS